MKGNILITLPEDKEKSKQNYFAIKNNIGGGDHTNLSNSLEKKGYNVNYVNWDDLREREFGRMFDFNSNSFVNAKKIDSMDLIFVYKQENFLNETERFYKMLDRFEESGALIINDPKTIKMNISKDYLVGLNENGLNPLSTYKLNGEVSEQISKGKSFIIKPKIGERGIGIEKINSLKGLEKFLVNPENYLAQEFLPSIREGEKSLGFIGLDYSHAVLKTPNPIDSNEYFCNKSKGGTISPYNPTEKEIQFSRKILEDFESRGYPVHFSRIDMANVNGKSVLIEAELLNPSIFANDSGKGDLFGEKFANYLDKLITERK